ncbi:Asp-tRNA(Asn)/Glu-tRNA(Gln) amidotransferase subunit GatA [soil metagenome]
MPDITWPSISEIVSQVKSGSKSAEENVKQALQIIAQKDKYKAIISTIKDRALERAKEVDKTVKSGGSAGRLAGVPFISKDNILTYGGDTTAASNILRGFEAPYQATAIELLEAEGAICVAKANLDAFGHGSSTENSDWFTSLNPHDKQRVSGGSSGGSAAAVVLDMAPFALGTDTGGSIRLPASFCGTVGFKPSYGLVSRSGVVAMASSADVVGPLARSVEDAAAVLDCMAGRDELDATTIKRDADSYLPSETSLKGKKIGVIKEHMTEGLDPEVRNCIESAISKIKERGAVVKEVSLPSLKLALACYYIITPAEISSNLSRYDGQRYGYSATAATNLEESYSLSRSEGFGSEAKRRIMIGTYVLSSGFYDAYYKRAQQVRTLIIQEFEKVFKDVDYLIGPTAAGTAFKLGEKSNDPLRMYMNDIMTVGVNLVGAPAISLPAGKSNDGLPIGLHVIAPSRQDKALLETAKAIEGIL